MSATPSTGVANAIINLPGGLGAGTFYSAFVAFPQGNPGAPWAISDPLQIQFN